MNGVLIVSAGSGRQIRRISSKQSTPLVMPRLTSRALADECWQLSLLRRRWLARTNYPPPDCHAKHPAWWRPRKLVPQLGSQAPLRRRSDAPVDQGHPLWQLLRRIHSSCRVPPGCALRGRIRAPPASRLQSFLGTVWVHTARYCEHPSEGTLVHNLGTHRIQVPRKRPTQYRGSVRARSDSD